MKDPHFVEAESLLLPNNHPGREDRSYLQRREMFFHLARSSRLARAPLTDIEYTDSENRLWRAVAQLLTPLHRAHASQIFLDGLKALELSDDYVPQLREIDGKLQRKTGFRLVPAEGLLAGNSYFLHWSNGEMPCTQFLRHQSEPAYTPEPDIVHDVLGHVPPLMNDQYCDIIRAFGTLSKRCGTESMVQLIRFYWFTIEFGLIRENNEMKVLGAGLLSSIGELPRALSESVTRVPFTIDSVIATDFDPNQMQSTLFVLDSLQQLSEAITAFAGSIR